MFLFKVVHLIHKLRAIGKNINNSHLSARLLCSVPISNNNLITALEARPERELTLDYIKTKVINKLNRSKKKLLYM